MNCIREIEIKDDDVYLNCTIFGISSESYKNDVLSASYKSGGQAALDKAIISMLLDDLYHIELSGDDPSIMPYKEALEKAEQQHVLDLDQEKSCQRYQFRMENSAELDPSSRVNSMLQEYVDSRNEQNELKLNAVVALIAR